MLQIGKSYEDQTGPYEVLYLESDKVTLRYLLDGRQPVAIAQVKEDIHTRIQFDRALGLLPAWTNFYELFFAKLTEGNFSIHVTLHNKYLACFQDDYEQLTGLVCPPVPEKKCICRPNWNSGTSFTIKAPAKVLPFVPAGIHVKPGRSTVVHSKALVYELFRRGAKLGANKKDKQ